MPVKVTVEGKVRLKAEQGEPLGKLLLQGNVTVLSTSFKYARERSFYCFRGYCMRCRVDSGEGELQACEDEVSGSLDIGLRIDPPLRRIMKRIISLTGLSAPYRYYHLVPPGPMANLFTRLIRWITATPRRLSKPVAVEATSRTLESDVVVVGGGPSGVGASIALAEKAPKTKVLLVDSQQFPGGILHSLRSYLYEDEPISADSNSPQDDLKMLHASLERLRVKTLRAKVFGIYRENGRFTVAAYHRRSYYLVRCDRIIVAAGTMDGWPLIVGADLPGVIGGGGALKVLNQWRLRPWRRLTIIGASRLALHILHSAIDSGAEKVTLITPDEVKVRDERLAELVEEGRASIVRGAPVEIRGRGSKRVYINVEGAREAVEADCVAYCDHSIPRFHLPAQVGASVEVVVDEADRLTPRILLKDESVRADVEGVYVAGGITGAATPREALTHGQLSAIAALVDSGEDQYEGECREKRKELRGLRRRRSTPLEILKYGRRSPSLSGAEIVCPCLDITVRDIEKAVNMGLRDIESVKRYTGVATGPCQGRICLLPTLEVMRGLGVEVLGLMRIRPPIFPVPVEVVARKPD